MFTPHTLKSPVTLEGIGLHTGPPCRVEVRPCQSPGRVFICEGKRIPALAEYVEETPRCTTLARQGARVSTVEHLLAALWLAGIDNAEMAVEGPEIPALDGCAAIWYSAIKAAGICASEGEVPVLAIQEARWIPCSESDFYLFPADGCYAYAAISFPGTVAERQMAGGNIAEVRVREQILRARTFALERDVRALLDAHLAHGGTLENAVVLTDDGYLNAQVWPQEPAWHKVLDLLGDLALVGARFTGQIIAVRGGHRSHTVLARQLRGEWLQQLSVRK